MPAIEVLIYIGAIGLSVIGLTGLLLHNNVFRMLLALAMLEAGVNLLLILAGFRVAGVAPIILPEQVQNLATLTMNDPVPQALVLTAIVIGVGVQALGLALIMRIKAQYGTLNMLEIREQLEFDLAAQSGVGTPVSAHSPESLAQGRIRQRVNSSNEALKRSAKQSLKQSSKQSLKQKDEQ